MLESIRGNPWFQMGFNKGQDSIDRMNAGAGMAERIAGGVMTIAVVALVLNEMFSLSVFNTTGPFSGLIDSVENIGGAALTLVVLGFLAAAGAAALSMFRGR